MLEIGPSRVMTEHLVPSGQLAPARYVAVDTRRLAHHRALRSPHAFACMDACRLAFPADTFRLLLCLNVLPYVHDYRAAIDEMHRVLAPGGLAVLMVERAGRRQTRAAAEMAREEPATYTPQFLAVNGDQWCFGEDFLRELASAGWQVRVEHPNRRLPITTLHRHGLNRDTELILAAHGETRPTGRS